MPKYDVDVTVSDESPTLFVSVDIGPHHIDTARNTDGDWEGSQQHLDVDLPAELEFAARGLPNRPYTLDITLTPTDGGAAVEYKTKDKKLSGRGFAHFEDTIKA